MNILYIYGWNSSPDSTTAKRLQQLLPNDTIISVAYDQTNPIEAVKFFNNFIIENKINAVVASSFGAFIGINIGHSMYKFLINPCLMPSVELPKLTDVSSDFIEQCQRLENNKKIVDDEDMRFTTAFFAERDELFSYKSMYLDLGYFKFKDLPNEQHQLSHNGLCEATKLIDAELQRASVA